MPCLIKNNESFPVPQVASINLIGPSSIFFLMVRAFKRGSFFLWFLGPGLILFHVSIKSNERGEGDGILEGFFSSLESIILLRCSESLSPLKVKYGEFLGTLSSEIFKEKVSVKDFFRLGPIFWLEIKSILKLVDTAR